MSHGNGETRDAYIPEKRAAQLAELCQRLAVEGRDPALLNQALTHGSYAFENPPAGDNERLEFLGDSIIGFVVAQALYRAYPDCREGELSKMKARIVSRALLGKIALQMELGDYVRLGRGEDMTGGRRRQSLLGSALEAVIGALYLSEGFETACRVIQEQLIDRISASLEAELQWDYKSRLQEYAQRRWQTVPRYETLHTAGPDHDKVFTVRVRILDHAFPEQSAGRKKVAENRAARLALEALEQGAVVELTVPSQEP